MISLTSPETHKNTLSFSWSKVIGNNAKYKFACASTYLIMPDILIKVMTRLKRRV